ncbi:PIN domain-containing protein [Prosthecobacter vanneervenii]|uniref:PIN domain nuclease of toxin-antitoxin system n=1 Tax=Prosthecobacter vanneervenii TaxID=48466 RepID=A0A7W7YAH3_9BACT|nr:PIN domain nuclease of toxin-antitoxin system [Prosthecobacter vanneervenii]
MKLLLDTCALIWLTSEPDLLSANATKAINDPAAVLCVSHASLWEIALKHSIGKLALPEPPRTWWSNQVARWGLVELPISAEALLASSELPKHHKDPFDRVILAQAQIDNCQLVSSDSEFPSYGIPLIW